MDAASSRLKRACGIHMKWEQVFDPVTMKIDRKYANVWLEDLPDLSVESSVTKVSDFLGEKLRVGSEEVSTKDLSLNAASSILLPKKFDEDFPLKSCGSKISRVFLREDLITLWNALVDGENRRKFNVLSAASGLGKSIYLYLITVFARHFKIPVQYIGNASSLVEDEANQERVVKRYLSMLLFMNAQNSAVLNHRFQPLSSRYMSLEAAALKEVIIYALKTGDIELCIDIRENIMMIGSLNLLIVDEHNALWQQFGNDPNSWPPFFKLYARPVRHSTPYCKFVIAGSQHYEFESKLPSGYEDSISYVEPLSKEEFEIWENLSDYPPNFKDKRNEIIDLTGLVPRVMGMLINMANASGDLSFEEVASNLKADISNSMKMRHVEYVDSLNDVKKADFAKMLYNLFLGGGTPSMTICDNAYRDRGLLITLKDRSLQLYNSVARDILFDTFTQFYFSENHLVELSQELKKARKGGSDGGACFEELFLGLCLRFRPEIQTCSRERSRTIHFQSNVLFRFDGKCFDRRLSCITTSCWIKFSRNYPRLDYAYVDMIDDGSWMLYLIQVSVSSFPAHNTDSAQLERLFMKTGGSVPLASLLNSFFDRPFEVSSVYNDRKKIVDFEVADSQGISFRDRISILYVTPLTREDAKADSAPEFVEFLTFDNFPGYMKSYIDVGRKVRRRRSSPNRSPVKRIKSEET
ncbi:hypothetical protein GAYE_SCF29G4867 [Galdieria yellowstonensis]|uniref:Crinkler (CRN) family protein n=1 Tax=Galdieria yellowstonensis TaxID=3028027 RepID=A0AAV9II76_9RHOD|nr:hypothetical protein GAYE_SCF29G4867 [Galdieria yellowstonensis]